MKESDTSSSELARLRAENRRLQERLDHYKRLHHLLGDVTYLHDFQQETYVEIDPNVERITGIPAEKLKVTDWSSMAETGYMIGEAENLEIAEAIQKYQAGELPVWAQEYRIQARDGKTRWIRDQSVPLQKDGGRFYGSFGILYDITELRNTQEQLLQAQKMESLGRMAGGIAHDFNNLLTAILGYTELIEQECDPETNLYTYAKNIRQAGERSADLVAQLLAFARRQVLTLRVLDVSALILETEPLLLQLLGEKVNLNLQAASEVWRVKADAGQLQQVLLNLASNARDAMPRGGSFTLVVSNVSLKPGDVEQIPAGDYVRLEIQDTGEGIDPPLQKQIFEPFFTTKPIGKGTGLGLSTCLGIVKQCKGHLLFFSQVGRGTTFRIYLPRTQEAAKILHRRAPSPETGETILVVEDETLIRQIAVNALAQAGYGVLTAKDGVEALELLETAETPIHLMITDVQMPRLGGIELVQKVRTRFPSLKIFFAISEHDTDLPPDLPALAKPYSAFQLRTKVRKVLDE